MPLVSAETVMGETVLVPVRVVWPVAVQVAVKPVVGLLPAVPGVKAMLAWPLPGVAGPMVGEPGGGGIGDHHDPGLTGEIGGGVGCRRARAINGQRAVRGQ